MRMRALLALLVLLGMLPVQGGIGANAGRADSGPTVFFLDLSGGANNLSLAAPSGNGSVVLGRNMTSNFTAAGISGLFLGGQHRFVLDLSLASLNGSEINLSCKLQLDYRGNGSVNRSVAFQNHTLSGAAGIKHALIDSGPVDPVAYGLDLRNGSLRLQLARIDGSDGLLEVLCGNGANASTLAIPHGAPLRADAGADLSGKTNRTISLDGSRSASVDPDGTQYRWDFGNGMSGAGRQATAVYDRAGNYTATLTLLWNGFTDSDTVLVRVADNRPPVANVTPAFTRRVGENITFRGDGTDPDGTIVSYRWAFGDGNSSSDQNATRSFATPGNYTVVLTVRDDDGAEGSASLVVRINFPPRIANISAARTGNQVRFQVLATDPDGTTLRYLWDFGDGTNASAASPIHRYLAAGTFTARCNVTDDYGDNATASVIVTIENSAPVIADLGLSARSYRTNEAVRFRPTVTDADGDVLSYEWKFGDGVTSQDPAPTHVYKKAGTYTVTLRVWDQSVSVMKTAVVEISESSAFALDPENLSLIFCIATFVIATLITAARGAAARKREQERGGVPQYGEGRSPPPGLPEPNQPYGETRSEPYGGAGSEPYGGAGSEPYGGTRYEPYGGTQQPLPPPRPARAPKAPPGACPRCGSGDLQRFPDGHAKCQSCKKIFFTG